MKKNIVVSISGASGSIYGIRLLKALLAEPNHVTLILSSAGRAVLCHETGSDLSHMRTFLESRDVRFHPEATLEQFEPDNLFASPASGSYRHDGMVIAPCSMKTVGAIASGIAENLPCRAADVCLKERRPLILVPREAPYSLIHLKNMTRLAEAGAVILPASPSFYYQPRTVEELVDTIVARILDHLDIEHNLARQWGV